MNIFSTILLILLISIVVSYILVLINHWQKYRTIQLTAPFFTLLALLGRESVVPRKADRLFFELGPALLLIVVILAIAVIPLSPDLIITDLATGALFLNAILAYVLVAVIMAGWGPDGGYGMVGGWRFLGQLVAYAMLIVMPITAVAMRAESLLTTDIVVSQSDMWNVFYQPVGFVLFYFASMAMAFLPPFDLPNASGELAGGIESEYSGVRLLIFRLGHILLVFTLAAATVTFYLGGWLGPYLPAWLWSVIKIILVAASMFSIGHFIPRIREAQLMSVCWKIGIPLALFNIFFVGVMVVFFP